jgi:hypothetical protein
MKQFDSNAETPSSSIAYLAGYVVRIGALSCPYCGRGLHAYDIELDGDVLRLICRGCHHDMLVVEATP